MTTAAVIGASVDYTVQGQPFTGYFARPQGSDKLPAVIVVQEWWGVNDHIRGKADAVAALGYAAFAVDMYGAGKRPDNPDQAGALMNEALSSEGAVEARFQAAVDWLSQRDDIDSSRVAAMGYCFGGAVVLAMARAGKPLAGVASFHGALATDSPAQAGVITAAVLVCHGNEDAMVSLEDVAALQAEMAAAGADLEYVGYDGALHGFTNPAADERGKQYGLPLAYNEAADTDSWRRLEGFLARVLAA